MFAGVYAADYFPLAIGKGTVLIVISDIEGYYIEFVDSLMLSVQFFSPSMVKRTFVSFQRT